MKSKCVGDAAAGDSGLVEGMTPAGIESLRTEGGADMGGGVIWTGEGLEVGAALNLEGSTLIFSFTLLKEKNMVKNAKQLLYQVWQLTQFFSVSFL